MARKTGRRKYRKEAEQTLRTIGDWITKGNPNVRQYSCLLKAEQAALKQRDAETDSMYTEAIIISGRTGQLHLAALSDERYADDLLVDHKDEDEARYRIEQAIRFYTDWSVDAVLERLRKNDLAKKP